MASGDRSEIARHAAEVRWQRDLEGIERHIDQVVKRWPAIPPEQRARLVTLLTDPRDTES